VLYIIFISASLKVHSHCNEVYQGAVKLIADEAITWKFDKTAMQMIREHGCKYQIYDFEMTVGYIIDGRQKMNEPKKAGENEIIKAYADYLFLTGESLRKKTTQIYNKLLKRFKPESKETHETLSTNFEIATPSSAELAGCSSSSHGVSVAGEIEELLKGSDDGSNSRVTSSVPNSHFGLREYENEVEEDEEAETCSLPSGLTAMIRFLADLPSLGETIIIILK
jgi:hypothetical protein